MNLISTEDPGWKLKCVACARAREAFELRNVKMFKDRLHLARLACAHNLRVTRIGPNILFTPEEAQEQIR